MRLVQGVVVKGKMALEKEHYVEALKYYEIMELLSDVQYLKTMLNDGYSFPKLIKVFVTKNEGISPRLLNLSYSECWERCIRHYVPHM